MKNYDVHVYVHGCGRVSWSNASSALLWSFLPLYASPGNDLLCINGTVQQLQVC
jgi:hypothetical protein